VRVEAEPGDYIFVPPFVAHREENRSPDEEAVVVIARSTQEAIVVNLPSLFAAPRAPAEPSGRGPPAPPRCRRGGSPKERARRWPIVNLRPPAHFM